MLVLNRRVGEEIVIGDSIRIFVIEIRGGQVRLGFEAPLDVPIVRREIRHRKLGGPPVSSENMVHADRSSRLRRGGDCQPPTVVSASG